MGTICVPLFADVFRCTPVTGIIGDNPARLANHLDHLLPRQVRPVEHYRAMAYTDVPAFMQTLRDLPALSARALEFVILTASRGGEVLGSTWDEVDLNAGVWTIPAGRMKAHREHRVPICSGAAVVLKRQAEIRHNDYVFPGRLIPTLTMIDRRLPNRGERWT
jgi:integrase